MLTKFIVCFIAGIGAGLGTGFAGMSAAAVISPMLITFLHIPAYEAVGIALSSDVLASAVSAYTYGKHKNLDIKNGIVMMISVLCFTLVGSYISSLLRVHDAASGNQVHCKARHDDKGVYGGCQPEETVHTVHTLRHVDRIHLRICRSGRRHDDASDSHQRARI